MLLGVVWVFVFGGIALVGLVVLVAYGVWLAHKASDVMSEVRVLGDRTDQLAELLAQVRVPELSPSPAQRHSDLIDTDEAAEARPT